MQLQLHYSTQHYANYITLRYNYNYNCNYNYTTVHNTRVHYTTLHYTNYTAPQLQLQLQLHYSTLITLHYNYSYNLTTLHYNYNYNCTTPHYIQQLSVRWPLQPLQPLQTTQLQPPFGPSVDSFCHPCITTTRLSNLWIFRHRLVQYYWYNYISYYFQLIFKPI